MNISKTKTHSLGQFAIIHCGQEFQEAVEALAADESLEFAGDAPTSFPILGCFYGDDGGFFYFDDVPNGLALDLVVARYGAALRAVLGDLVD